MIDSITLDAFNSIDIKKSLIVEKDNLKYDFNNELWDKITDIYNLIKESISYINEKTPSQFSNNIAASIRILINMLKEIQQTEESLWNNFDRQKNAVIRSVKNTIWEIFSFLDWPKLLITLNFLKNDYFTKNTEKISENIFDKWSSWKNEGMNSLISMIEEKAKKANEEALKAEKSSELLQEVKSWAWLTEIKMYQEKLSKYYSIEKIVSLILLLVIAVFFIAYLIGLKLWWFVDYDKFNLEWYYMYSQIMIWFVILSLFWYLLKLSVDQFRLSSNILNNLKHKWSIINSYKLLFRTEWSEAEKIELNKLIIEKTTENLFSLWNGTHYWKEEKIDIKLYDKILEILPKLK